MSLWDVECTTLYAQHCSGLSHISVEAVSCQLISTVNVSRLLKSPFLVHWDTRTNLNGPSHKAMQNVAKHTG